MVAGLVSLSRRRFIVQGTAATPRIAAGISRTLYFVPAARVAPAKPGHHTGRPPLRPLVVRRGGAMSDRPPLARLYDTAISAADRAPGETDRTAAPSYVTAVRVCRRT